LGFLNPFAKGFKPPEGPPVDSPKASYE